MTLAKISADWTAELGEEMDDEDWNRALHRLQ